MLSMKLQPKAPSADGCNWGKGTVAGGGELGFGDLLVTKLEKKFL
jgi:hypothetical protein